MAKPKSSLPSYYDGKVLNRKRELEFLAEQASSRRGLELDFGVNTLMGKIEEYEMLAARAPDDAELAELAESGKALLNPLLARQRSHGHGAKAATLAESDDPSAE